MRHGVLVLLVWLTVAGCGGDHPTAPTQSLESFTVSESGDSLSLPALNPAPGTILQAGRSVPIALTVQYTLASADFGRVILAIQDDTGRLLQRPPQPVQPVRRGSGTLNLSDQISIPAGGVSRVDLFVPMVRGTANQTTLRLVVQYDVRP
jgi:hypothetical protein